MMDTGMLQNVMISLILEGSETFIRSIHTKNLSVVKLRFNKHIVIRCSTVQYCYSRVSLKYISYCMEKFYLT